MSLWKFCLKMPTLAILFSLPISILTQQVFGSSGPQLSPKTALTGANSRGSAAPSPAPTSSRAHHNHQHHLHQREPSATPTFRASSPNWQAQLPNLLWSMTHSLSNTMEWCHNFTWSKSCICTFRIFVTLAVNFCSFSLPSIKHLVALKKKF